MAKLWPRDIHGDDLEKGKKWQVQIRRIAHKPIFRTFKTKGEAKIFGMDAEAKLDRGEVMT